MLERLTEMGQFALFVHVQPANANWIELEMRGDMLDDRFTAEQTLRTSEAAES